jgi:hypothetical protein
MDAPDATTVRSGKMRLRPGRATACTGDGSIGAVPTGLDIPHPTGFPGRCGSIERRRRALGGSATEAVKALSLLSRRGYRGSGRFCPHDAIASGVNPRVVRPAAF